MIGGLAACGNTESAASADAGADVVVDVATDAADATDAPDSLDADDVAPTACQPYCGAIGTKSEAWFGGCTHAALTDPATGFPMWDLCTKCVAVCKLDGSKSEGWYSSCTDKLIQWNNCM